MPLTLGKRIDAAMRELDISDKDLADDLGVSLSTISRWRRDLTKPRPSEVRALETRLKSAPAWNEEESLRVREEHEIPESRTSTLLNNPETGASNTQDAPATARSPSPTMPTLPPPTPNERVLELAAEGMDPAGVANLIRRTLIDEQIPKSQRLRLARRLSLNLIQRIDRELPNEG